MSLKSPSEYPSSVFDSSDASPDSLASPEGPTVTAHRSSSSIATPRIGGNFPRIADPVLEPSTLAPTSPLGAKGSPLPWWKRAIDLSGCIIALPLLALCTVAMVIVTRRVSPGPVFFYQERIGYMGRRFRLFKFRTMKRDADCSIHHAHCSDLIRSNVPMVKLDHRNDSRLIPLAWLLRASGLDELPQIINVLRGEMSLVGPRPCTPAEFAHYRSWHRQRCDSLPGLTGLWQVSGKNRTTFEQMIGLDLRYARDISLWQDLRIIALTPCSLIAQVRETRRARASSVHAAPFAQTCGEAKTA